MPTRILAKVTKSIKLAQADFYRHNSLANILQNGVRSVIDVNIFFIYLMSFLILRYYLRWCARRHLACMASLYFSANQLYQNAASIAIVLIKRMRKMTTLSV